ncbi:hypothetical protein COCNU_05G001230 [Cocos nucifera]|uniref:Uncharacterized protein n=1 Tax=Cocos nucifera TaxID=13894 RepID=A0A8K0N166_COCNU|nr:hypothetical protein COCNU_05G001230 [Cocos nucifera]
MEVELSGSSAPQRSDSYRRRIVGRSWSSRLVLESVSSECAAVAAYGRLSQSMRAFDDPQRQQHKGRLRVALSRLFSRKDGAVPKLATEAVAGKTKEKKKRSKWLPDPDRRWPVQGW